MLKVPSSLAAALPALLLVPAPVLAEGLAPSKTSQLEARLLAVEDELAATKAALAVYRPPAQAAEPAAASSVDRFFSGLEVGGHLAASYVYNLNKGDASGSANVLCQFNCAQNQFKFDAAKLEIGRPSDGPGSVGFQLDLLFGQNADILRGLSPTASSGAFGEDDFSVFVQQAYIEYDWNGTLLKFGNWETLLGFELIDSNDNPNITHGVLFTWAIPLYHTGILASGSLSEEVGWALGLTNGFNNTIDTNDSKGLVGQLSYESGELFTSLSGYYGSESAEGTMGQPGSSDSQLILDLVTTLNPSEDLSLWLNLDWGEQEDGDATAGDAEWWGVAVGASFKLSERSSVALRGEYFEDDDYVRGISTSSPPLGVPKRDLEIWSLTGTYSHRVTDNLLMRAELRYDEADDDIASGNIFVDDSSSGFDDDELLGVLEVVYEFD